MLDKVLGVGRGEVGDVRVDGDVGVGLVETGFGGDRFGGAVERVLIGEEGLSMEVGALDEVPVDDGELSNPSAGEEVGADTAQRPHSHDERVGCGEFGLAFGSDRAGPGLSCVALVVGVWGHGEV